MSRKIFYHSADEGVHDEIKARQWRYGAKSRAPQFDKENHNSFVGAKTAYVSVSADGHGTVLGFIRKGYESLYNTSNPDAVRPRAVLQSVNINHDGDFGTIQRANVSFKCFDLEQLEYFERNVLSVGQEVTVNYGWTAQGGGPNNGSMTGITHNFSFNLQPDGGFNCTFDLVGEGYYTLGADPTSQGEIEKGGGTVDENGKVNITYTGVALQLSVDIPKEKPEPGKVNKRLVGYTLNMVAASKIEEGQEAGTDTIHYYTCLEYIVDQVNTMFKGSNISYDVKECYGHVDKLVMSHAIDKIIFPSKTQGLYTEEKLQEKYGSVDKIKVGGKEVDLTEPVQTFYDESEKAATEGNDGQKLDTETSVDFSKQDGFPTFGEDGDAYLGAILISLNALQAIQNEVSINSELPTTAEKFFDFLFELIYQASGGAYDLTLMVEESVAGEKSTKTLIVNKKYHDKAKIDPVVFSPFGPNSVVRNINLSGQIPDALATMAYFAGSNLSQVRTQYPDAVSQLLLPEGKAEEAANATEEAAEAVKQSVGTNVGIALWEAFLAPRKEREWDPENLQWRIEGSQGNGPTALSKYVNSLDEKWNDKMLLPLKLSVTLDGIEGFKFGDVITTDYLPKRYRNGQGGYEAVFTVTKVGHSISGQDWTTTLETVCRLHPNASG